MLSLFSLSPGHTPSGMVPESESKVEKSGKNGYIKRKQNNS